MAVVLARSAADRWLNMAIIVAFAAASLLLSGAGLYGVPRFDPVSFAAAGALLFAVALTASYIPARRAALTDPAGTLRAE